MAEKQYLTVDGNLVEINGEKNLLELIRKQGIKLPTFCYYTDLSIYGACRMCMVENDRGGLEAACSTPPRPGMNIKTNTGRLRKYRRMILELLIANHCNDCATCDQNTNCKLQAYALRFGIKNVRFPNTYKNTERKDTSSVSLDIDTGRCILCGDCVRTCNEVQTVGAIDFAFRGSKMVVSTAFGKPLAETGCVGCGQCSAVCPTGAIVPKNNISKVWDAIDNPKLYTTVQIAPAVRVAIGHQLREKDGENVMGKIVAALRYMGIDAIYDTTFGADMTVIEETNEFIERLESNTKLPLMTSCCPGWIRYVETKYPEFLPNISTCRSPMQMFASVLKDKARKDGKKMFHIAVMPCTAKKYEANREEFKVGKDPNVDAVITTKELITMIKESGIVFNTIDPEPVDMPFGTSSGAGVIFGVTGGVTEAVLRNAMGHKGSVKTIAKMGQRGLEEIKEFDIPFGEKTLHAAVVSGLGNAEKILNRIKNGEKFDFVEVMACPGGCINGGGQPFDNDAKEERGKGLYTADRHESIRNSNDNPLLRMLYQSEIAGREHELLHVDYVKKS